MEQVKPFDTEMVVGEIMEDEAPAIASEESMILAVRQEEQVSQQKSETAPQVEAAEEHKQSLGSQR